SEKRPPSAVAPGAVVAVVVVQLRRLLVPGPGGGRASSPEQWLRRLVQERVALELASGIETGARVAPVLALAPPGCQVPQSHRCPPPVTVLVGRIVFGSSVDGHEH